jgi:hypothetical protein
MSSTFYTKMPMPCPHPDSPTHPLPSSDFDYLYPFESLPLQTLLTTPQLTSPQLTTPPCPTKSLEMPISWPQFDPNETLEDHLYPFKSQRALDSALDTLEDFLASLEEQRTALGKTVVYYPVSPFPVPILQLLTCLSVLLSYSTTSCTTSPTPPFRRPVPSYHLPLISDPLQSPPASVIRGPIPRQTLSLQPPSMVARTGLPSGSLDGPLDEPAARFLRRWHAFPVTSTAAGKSARPPEIFKGINNH